MGWLRAATWSTVGVALGCGTDAAPPVTADDAIGPQWTEATAWTVGAEPLLEVSGDDPEHLLTRIAGVVITDSVLVVANQMNPPAVHAFDREGRRIWTQSGEGDGPGEFRLIARLWRSPDGQVLAYDPFASRVTRLDVATGRPDPRPLPVSGATGAGVVLTSLIDEGLFLGRTNLGMERGTTGEGRSLMPLYRVDLEAGTVDTIMRAHRLDYYTDDDGRPMLPLFGRQSMETAGGGRVFLGMADSFAVTELTPRGDTAGVLRRPWTPRPVTDALVDSMRLRELGQARTEDQRAFVERKYLEGRRERTLPAYDRLLFAEGHLLVRAYLAPGDTVGRWTVFGPDRTWLGELTTPAGFELVALAGDRVAGFTLDGFGVPSVRVHALRRP